MTKESLGPTPVLPSGLEMPLQQSLGGIPFMLVMVMVMTRRRRRMMLVLVLLEEVMMMMKKKKKSETISLPESTSAAMEHTS